MSQDVYEGLDISESLQHEGRSILDGAPGPGSGRYPRGSGENPYQHNSDSFSTRVSKLRKEKIEFVDPDTGEHLKGDSAIAKMFGMTVKQLKAAERIDKDDIKHQRYVMLKKYADKGMTPYQIGKEVGMPENSVRSYLNEDTEFKRSLAKSTADFLKKKIDEHKMVDVGVSMNQYLNVPQQKLDDAIYLLEKDGYKVMQVKNPIGPGKMQTITAICAPDVQKKELYDYKKIYNPAVDFVSHDEGVTFDKKYVYPKSLDSKRLMIRYAEDGGEEKDGTIELRRGLKDISLGNSHYAQVRILVDGSHYLKGMAVYSDDLPDGVDVLFNTNKKRGTPALGDDKNNTVLKKIKESDPTNPFGSLIKSGIYDPDDPTAPQNGGQSYYYDENGKKQLSVINKRSDEGDWQSWSNKLSPQFLGKQNAKLIKQQLNLTYDQQKLTFDEIMSLNNPTVKKYLLNEFALECDKKAVNLKTMSLPRQKYQVILPEPTLSDNEVYAPNYQNGEKVALIRYPHGYTGEIPILTVNNKNKNCIKTLGKNPTDAVCINKRNADILSGADFDGDTVLVIPCNSSKSNVHISNQKPYPGLVNFDPKREYARRPGDKFKTMSDTQKQMGIVSNLITDMIAKGAPAEDIEKAVKHSMVVIDAEKHDLNYQLSEEVNDIKALTKKWQEHIDLEGKTVYGGASTLLSRASAETRVYKRQGNPKINPEDGSLIYKTADNLYYQKKEKVKKKLPNGRIVYGPDGKPEYERDENGKIVYRTLPKVYTRQEKISQMSAVKDARILSSGTAKEELYADYANKMKAMANRSRLEFVNTTERAYSPEAFIRYRDEVDSLKRKLSKAKSNKPLERAAQAMATSVTNEAKRADPDISKAELKKIRQNALVAARAKVGAQRYPIDIEDKEWEAIQKGAIHKTTLSEILQYTDSDKIKERALPKTDKGLTDIQVAKIMSLYNSYRGSGDDREKSYTNSEIAKALGISTSLVSKVIKGDYK